MATAPVSRSLSEIMLEDSLESEPAQNVHASGRREPQAQLLVLSCNPDIIGVVRNAAHLIAQVTQVRDLDDVERSLLRLDPGVLIVDGSSHPCWTIKFPSRTQVPRW